MLYERISTTSIFLFTFITVRDCNIFIQKLNLIGKFFDVVGYGYVMSALPTDSQKSVDTSQSTSSTTEESARAGEVATATLINLESPGSAPPPQDEDQLDSIEAGDQWQNSRMQLSTISAVWVFTILYM